MKRNQKKRERKGKQEEEVRVISKRRESKMTNVRSKMKYRKGRREKVKEE